MRLKSGSGRKKKLALTLLTALCGLLTVGGAIYWNVQSAGQRCYAPADVPAAPVALVFGCGYSAAGPSPVMYDRVATAAELYHAGKVRKLLLTGDNSQSNYNEPEMMRQTALRLGVPNKDIILDRAGLCTYDSIYRAKFLFKVSSAILVSQAYHLPRALFIARQLGLDAVGAAAEPRRAPVDFGRWQPREVVSCEVAWFQAKYFRPRPRFLDKPEPIRE